MRRLRHYPPTGLAAGQMLLVIFIIGALAGGGVFYARQNRNKPVTKHSVTVPDDAKLKITGDTRTSDAIDELEQKSEEKINAISDKAYQSTAQSAEDSTNTISGGTDDEL